MKKIALILIILLVLPFAYSYTLRDYPDMFVKESKLNVNIVVGDLAIASDTIGAIEIATSLQYNPTTKESFSGLRAVLASEIVDFSKENVISVGGPCANGVTAELMNFPPSCSDAIEPNTGIIKLYEFESTSALVVAGFSAMDTRRACRALANYYSQSLPNSNHMEVFFTKETEILVN